MAVSWLPALGLAAGGRHMHAWRWWRGAAMSWLLALGLGVGGLAVLVWLVPAAPLTGDGQHYIAFVRNHLQHGASAWHERRLLGPLIVQALPLDAQAGFLVLTLSSLLGATLLVWRAVRRLVPSEVHALASIPLLLGTWVAAPNVREYGLVDPLAWAFVAAVWLATVKQQWALAAAIGAVGVVAKEVVVLAAVAAAAAAWNPRRPLAASGVAAPAIGVAVLLTVLFPGSGGDASAYVVKWVKDGLGSLGPARVAFLLFASYASLWLLLPRGVAGLPSHLRRASAVYLLAGLALPLVGSPERMEEAIFPVVVTSAVVAGRGAHPALVWAVALGNALFVARVGADAAIAGPLAWSGLALACALAASTYPRPAVVLRAARGAT